MVRLTHAMTYGSPAWLASLGLAVGEWGEISGTNMSAVPPDPVPAGTTGPSAKVGAWTSFAELGGAIYSVANGGHGDYSGNEVNKLDLLADSPAWGESLASTASGDVVSSATHYNDGRPVSRHSYYGHHADRVAGRILLLGGSRYGNGFGVGKMDSYNVGSNSYNAAGTHPDLPSGVETLLGFAVASDPSTSNLVVFGNEAIDIWTQSTNSFTRPRASGGPYGYEAASAYDTTRGRAFVLGGLGAVKHTYAPGTDTLTNQTLSGAEAANVLGSQNAMVYVPSLDAYLLRKKASGGTVYKIDANTFECTDFGTTGGASIPAITDGPYNKFLYLSALGVIVYCPSYTGNAWALRVH